MISRQWVKKARCPEKFPEGRSSSLTALLGDGRDRNRDIGGRQKRISGGRREPKRAVI
jgi:hypothetical protein